MKRSKILWLAAVALVLACGAEEPPAPTEVIAEPEEEAVAEAPAETEPLPDTTEGPEPGTLVGEPGTVPNSFPSDIPFYPESRTTQLSKNLDAGAALIFSVDSEPEPVFEFYVEELAARGWKIKSTEVDDGEAWSIRATKDDRSVFVSVGFDYDTGRGATYGIAHRAAD